jgi:hypothetical protein
MSLHIMNKAVILILAALCWSCSQDPTEKKQYERDNIINVKDRVQEIVINDVLIGDYSQVHTIDNYLLIVDPLSPDKQIHLFDKNNFAYVTSTAPMGEAPGYITQMANVAIDESHRKFQINDTGRMRIYSYDLDSVLTENPDYLPEIKMETDQATFPIIYQYFNDTLSIGVLMKPDGTSNFQHLTARMNMQTGVTETMEYEHPEIIRKRISVAASPEHNMYVEVYRHHDLFTICSLDGELKYNVYGRKWNNRMSNSKNYFQNVKIYNDKFIAEYFDGGDHYYREKTGRIRSARATQLIIFSLQGDYITTFDVGYDIIDFCCDKENNRLILSFDDEIQFGYLNLDGLISS